MQVLFFKFFQGWWWWWWWWWGDFLLKCVPVDFPGTSNLFSAQVWSRCPQCVLISDHWPSLVWDLGVVFSWTPKKGSTVLFVAFSSLFLFMFFPTGLHVASLQNWRCRLPCMGDWCSALSLWGPFFLQGPQQEQLHFKARKRDCLLYTSDAADEVY